MKFSLRLLYLYLFSFVGLIIVVIGSIGLVNLGLKTYIFTQADYYEVTPALDVNGKQVSSVEEETARQKREVDRQRQRQLAESASAILVGLPVYLYHWQTIQREKRKLT